MKEETTLNVLARMLVDGFAEMRKEFVELRVELKGDIKKLGDEVRSTNRRIDTLIIPTIDDHSRRIKDLEIKTA